jgi:hypothetical protein
MPPGTAPPGMRPPAPGMGPAGVRTVKPQPRPASATAGRSGNWRSGGLFEMETIVGLAATTAMAGAITAGVMYVNNDAQLSAQVATAAKDAKRTLTPVAEGVVQMQKAVQGGWTQVDKAVGTAQKAVEAQWKQVDKKVEALLPGGAGGWMGGRARWEAARAHGHHAFAQQAPGAAFRSSPLGALAVRRQSALTVPHRHVPWSLE